MAVRSHFVWSALLLIAIGGAYGIYRSYAIGVATEQRGLLLASVFRDHVPGLRTPLYFSSAAVRQLKAEDIAITSTGRRFGCEYSFFKLCQTFSISSALLSRPDVTTALLHFIDEPCDALSVAKSGETRREDNNKKLHMQVAEEFFGCKASQENHATLIIHIADDMDDAGTFPKKGRLRLTKSYR